MTVARVTVDWSLDELEDSPPRCLTDTAGASDPLPLLGKSSVSYEGDVFTWRLEYHTTKLIAQCLLGPSLQSQVLSLCFIL